VMFEKPLMDRSAALVAQNGGSVLNVGFGLGLIDSALAQFSLREHVIVEAHRDVLAWMEEGGWHLRPNVEIIRSRWEDVDWSKCAGRFNGVFFDPFPYEKSVAAEIWHEVIRMIVAPKGRLVIYGPSASDEEIERLRDLIRRPTKIEKHPCDITIP